MKKLIHWFTPPESWRKPVIVMLGIFFGQAAYAVYISKAPSYLSDNPKPLFPFGIRKHLKERQSGELSYYNTSGINALV